MKGDSFGELALMELNNIRTATIVCSSPCEFLRVNRDEFNQILKASHKRELKYKEEILRKPNAFCLWREIEIADLLTHTQRREFRPGEVIFRGIRGGYAEHYVVVLASGTAHLLRQLPVVVHSDKGTLILFNNDKRFRLHRRHRHGSSYNGSSSSPKTDQNYEYLCNRMSSSNSNDTNVSNHTTFRIQRQTTCLSDLTRENNSTENNKVSRHSSLSRKRFRDNSWSASANTREPLYENSHTLTESERTTLNDNTSSSSSVKRIWVTSDALPIGIVLASWKESHALISNGCECLFLPRAVFYKFEKGRALINAMTMNTSSQEMRGVKLLLHASDNVVFTAFKKTEQWEYFKFQVVPSNSS